MIYVIALFASLAWDVFGWLFTDWDEAKRHVYYGSGEGNRKYENSYGQADFKKVLIWGLGLNIGGAIAVGTLGYFLSGPTQNRWDVALGTASVWLAGFGTAHFITGIKNRKKDATIRATKQRPWREKLKAQLGSEMFWMTLPVKAHQDNWFAPLVRHITVKATSAEDARIKLKPFLTLWANLPESDQKAIWGDMKFDKQK